MKKRMVAALLTTMLAVSVFTGCVSNPTTTTGAGGATSAAAEFNPDNEAGVEIGDLRKTLGAIPKPAGAIKLGAVAKAFENEYWRTLKEGYGVFEGKLKANGFDVTIDVQSAQGEGDEQGQLTIVKNMINQKYSGLLLSPISDGNLVPGVEDAMKAGIPVVNVNDGLIANAEVFVGPKAIQNGELAAEWIAEKLGNKGQVAIVIGMPKAFAARQRTAGFEQYMAANAKDIEIVAKQNADWDRSKAKDLADTWIKKYPELKAIFCNNDTMALGVVEAVKASGKDILVVGVDGIGEAYDSIKKGELDATIDSFPLYKSQIATEVALRKMGGQTVPRVIWTPQALIDTTNVDQAAADIIKWEEPEFAK